jgi:ADP-ribose pyrophosphatase YjhB (NUDIX family)
MENRAGEVKLIADVTVIVAERVLLVRYTDANAYDYQHGWFLPDDAVRHLEHPDDAAARILSDQLGLETRPTLDHIESFSGKDRSWHLVFHYALRLPAEPTLHHSKDVASAEWFATDALPPRREVAHGGWALGTIDRVLRVRELAAVAGG